jgi:hypothetical protein
MYTFIPALVIIPGSSDAMNAAVLGAFYELEPTLAAGAI